MGSIQSGGNWDFDFGESVPPIEIPMVWHWKQLHTLAPWHWKRLLGRPNCHFQLRPCGINLIRLDGCLAFDDRKVKSEGWKRENPPATDTCVVFFLWCSYYQENPGGEDEFYLEYAPRMDNDTMTPTTHSSAWRTRKTVKIETYSLKLWIQSLARLNPPTPLTFKIQRGPKVHSFFFPPYHLPAQSSSRASWPIGTSIWAKLTKLMIAGWRTWERV